MKTCIPFLLIFFLASCSHSYYVVRHAEKAEAGTGTVMYTANDPQLSEAGQRRAIALREFLRGKKIKYIYSTNTVRTRSTAQPLSDAIGVSIQHYGPMPDNEFIQMLKRIDKNTLIVGHSNTIDDIANALVGEKKVDGDLPESVYDQIFIIRYKKSGRKISFERKTFGHNVNQ